MSGDFRGGGGGLRPEPSTAGGLEGSTGPGGVKGAEPLAVASSLP